MQLYAITDRSLLPGTEQQRRAALVELARNWAQQGINYIQIREKDLSPSDLLDLTQQIIAAVRQQTTHTRVLLNGPAQIALEAQADGIHLPANAPQNAAEQTRNLFHQAGRDAILSHACHTREEILKVREESQRDPYATVTNTLILYAPIFEKIIPEGKLTGQGLETLKHAVKAAKTIPVFALGGATKQNAPACIAAGATGIAGIRIFLDTDGLSELR